MPTARRSGNVPSVGRSESIDPAKPKIEKSFYGRLHRRLEKLLSLPEINFSVFFSAKSRDRRLKFLRENYKRQRIGKYLLKKVITMSVSSWELISSILRRDWFESEEIRTINQINHLIPGSFTAVNSNRRVRTKRYRSRKREDKIRKPVNQLDWLNKTEALLISKAKKRALELSFEQKVLNYENNCLVNKKCPVIDAHVVWKDYAKHLSIDVEKTSDLLGKPEWVSYALDQGHDLEWIKATLQEGMEFVKWRIWDPMFHWTDNLPKVDSPSSELAEEVIEELLRLPQSRPLCTCCKVCTKDESPYIQIEGFDEPIERPTCACCACCLSRTKRDPPNILLDAIFNSDEDTFKANLEPTSPVIDSSKPLFDLLNGLASIELTRGDDRLDQSYFYDVPLGQPEFLDQRPSLNFNENEVLKFDEEF